MAKRPNLGPKPLAVRKRPYRPQEHKHEPTESQRLAVASLVSIGHSMQVISEALDIPDRTLKRHYAHELKHGREIIHARVGGSIVAQALAGHVTMQIFYAKAQMGWRDRHSHAFEKPDGSVADPTELFTISITG